MANKNKQSVGISRRSTFDSAEIHSLSPDTQSSSFQEISFSGDLISEKSIGTRNSVHSRSVERKSIGARRSSTPSGKLSVKEKAVGSKGSCTPVGKLSIRKKSVTTKSSTPATKLNVEEKSVGRRSSTPTGKQNFKVKAIGARRRSMPAGKFSIKEKSIDYRRSSISAGKLSIEEKSVTRKSFTPATKLNVEVNSMGTRSSTPTGKLSVEEKSVGASSTPAGKLSVETSNEIMQESLNDVIKKPKALQARSSENAEQEYLSTRTIKQKSVTVKSTYSKILRTKKSLPSNQQKLKISLAAKKTGLTLSKKLKMQKKEQKHRSNILKKVKYSISISSPQVKKVDSK